MDEGRHEGSIVATAQGGGSGAIATAVATITGNAFLIVGTLILGTLATLVGWIPPSGHWMYVCARWWSKGVLLTSWVRYEATFEEPLDERQSYIIMSNHQSLYDIPLLIATLPKQTRFVAKKSLFRIPALGWSLKAGGFIPVDRENPASAQSTFAKAVRSLDEGVSVVIFPEQTRSLDGELLPFKRGGFLMALKTGLPIVPVGVRGTLGVRARGSWAIHPRRVSVHYGRPLPLDDFGVRNKAALVAEVRLRVAELAGVDGG